jgi:uncharacterized delta-60 repeat protein
MELRLTSAGAPDTSFNGTGVSILSTPATVSAAVVRSTGVVIYAGNSPTIQDIVVGQFAAGGSYDSSFNSTGTASLDIPTTVAGIGKTAMLQSDGKLLVAGTYSQGVGYGRGMQGVVTRYDTNGTLDTSFGTGGYSYINFSGTFNLINSVLQSNGDIVVEGTVTDPGHTTSYVAVERLLPTGAVDTSFGVGGAYLLNTAEGYDTFTNAAALLRLSDDSLLVVTSSSSGGQITKLSATQGLPVTSYGTLGTGIVKDTSHQWTSGTLDSTGLPVLNDGTLERYTAAGTLDTTFANATSAQTGALGNTSMAIEPDGKIISSSFQSGTLQRNLTTGSKDFNFSGVPAVLGITLGAVAALPNGDIIAAGKLGTIPVCLAFDAAGAPIFSFGTSGAQSYSAATAANAIVVRSNGKIILVGQNYGAEIVIQLNGLLPAVLPGDRASANTFTLALSVNGQFINWTATSHAITRTGSIPVTDPAGILINGNPAGDSINLDFTNGNPLPTVLQFNGSYTLYGLSGTNPLANRTIDIGSNTLFINYGNPATDPVATLRGYLKNGYNNGSWTGTPTASTGVITSTVAAATPLADSIGYADSADVANPAGLPANTLELRYTVVGDTNLDGTVGLADLAALLKSYGSGTHWDQGEIPYSTTVGLTDLAALLKHYGQTASSPAALPTMSASLAPAMAADGNDAADSGPSLQPAVKTKPTRWKSKIHAVSRSRNRN